MLTAQFTSVFPVVVLIASLVAIVLGPHSNKIFSWIMAWKKRAKVIAIFTVKKSKVPKAA